LQLTYLQVKGSRKIKSFAVDSKLLQDMINLFTRRL